ncbi:hypothetical protein B0H11DRAFT_159190 [Mycena galericulata]|nr:hypothetical protein B0H11DRAFT_159190 [Mycena galericulata]
MPHKVHRSLHGTAIFFGVLLVLILAHLVFLFAKSPSSSRSSLVRADGRWVAVRRSLRLPPPKSSSKTPPLSLGITSRFDLKRKRALEESVAFSDVDAPPQLYFAPDALVDDAATHEQIMDGLRAAMLADPGEETSNRKGKNGAVRTKARLPNI